MVSEIVGDLTSTLGQNIQPTFGYYRQPNGWITISPNTRLERLKYTEEGWEYLEAYGAFDLTAYSVNHPFEGLFMFGGAKEMCADQLLQTGLYFDPPLVPRCRQHLTQFHRAHSAACWRGAKNVEFPQMAEVAKVLIGPFPCEFCQRKLPTSQALEQHQRVAHTTPLNNIELGRTLGKTLSTALGSSQAAPPVQDSEAQLLQRVAELEAILARQEDTPPGVTAAHTACGCGGTYKPSGKNFHQRTLKHREWVWSNEQSVAQPT